MIYLVLFANLPTASISGNNFLWPVLSINFENSINKPGIKVNTESNEQKIALIKTIAKSKPMPKCIKPKAAKPDIVVKDEDEISGIALDKAITQASLAGNVSCSSENL